MPLDPGLGRGDAGDLLGDRIPLPRHAAEPRIDRRTAFSLENGAPTMPSIGGEAHGRTLVLSSLLVYEGSFGHGGNCRLFPTGDVEMLAHGSAALAGSNPLGERLGRTARETALSHILPAFRAEFDALLNRILA